MTKVYRINWNYEEMPYHPCAACLENIVFSSVEELNKTVRRYIYDYNEVRDVWEEWYEDDNVYCVPFDEWVEDTLEYIMGWEELEVWGT